MKKSIILPVIIIVVIVLGIGLYIWKDKESGRVPQNTNSPQQTETVFSVPDGFTFEAFASNVPNARVMVVAPRGVLIVSQPKEGKIVALPDINNDGVADEKVVVAENLVLPHGLAFRCADTADPENCDLYVAEQGALLVFDYNAATMKAINKQKLLDLPAASGDRHKTRTLLFMGSPNENKLLISVGSSCDVCDEENPNRGAVLSYDVVTGKYEQYSKGLRNAVFMTLHPVTGKVWATEMGRDGLGDNLPPDEINILEKGKNYGWPVCYGKNIHDTQFDKKTYIRNPCMAPFETASHVDLQAHSAPLGLSFIPEEGWPEDHWFNLLVAYHGSWNRSTPTGYKIVRIKLNDKGEYLGIEDFITGWLSSDGKRIGRPADILVLSGGVAYISDDDAGKIYKLSRN